MPPARAQQRDSPGSQCRQCLTFLQPGLGGVEPAVCPGLISQGILGFARPIIWPGSARVLLYQWKASVREGSRGLERPPGQWSLCSSVSSMIGTSSPLQQLHLRPHSLVFPMKSLAEALKGHHVELISLAWPGPDQKDRTQLRGPCWRPWAGTLLIEAENGFRHLSRS